MSGVGKGVAVNCKAWKKLQDAKVRAESISSRRAVTLLLQLKFSRSRWYEVKGDEAK